MGWTRLDSSWHQEKRHRRVGLFGRLVLQAAVQMSEARDWQRDERRGWVPAAAFDAEEVALQLALAGDAALLDHIAYADLLAALELGLAACAREGLLVADGAAGWWIDGWSSYRKDPTATVRKRRERAKKRGRARHGDARDGVSGDASGEVLSDDRAARADVTDGHAGHRDKRAEARESGRDPGEPPECHRDARDVTPRDGTSRPPKEEEGEALPPPPSEDTERPAAAAPPLPGVRPWPAPDAGDLTKLERELRGIEFDRGDQRRSTAMFHLRSQHRGPGWIEEVKRLLAQPRTANGNGAVREAAHA